MTDFDRAMEFVLKWEGGYTDNPADPGGETRYGISKRAYPMLDIKNLTVEDAKIIYEKDYWKPSGCDHLTWPMNLVVFDCAVNQGVGRAIEFREKAHNYMDVIMLRIEHYNKLRKPQFLPGWINRIVDLWRFCKDTEHPLTTEYK